MPRVEVKGQNKDWVGMSCIVDGKKIPRVIAVDFHYANDEIPVFNFKLVGKPDIDMTGRVSFDFSPENLHDACFIVSEELKRHGDFYKSFVSSIQSVIKEMPPGEEMWSNELAEKIVKRISGEE